MPMRRLLLLAFLAAAGPAGAAPGPSAAEAPRLDPADPAWAALAAGLGRQRSVTAPFTENRWFPFRQTPTVLAGEARVSAAHGLSLHYLEPTERTVIIDDRGMLVRTPEGDRPAPSDPRTDTANAALLQVLRLNLAALAESFELHGRRDGAAWQLALVPRDAELRRTLGEIDVAGEGDDVRRIELRRSAVQRVEILIGPPRSTAPFTPAELARFFRRE